MVLALVLVLFAVGGLQTHFTIAGSPAVGSPEASPIVEASCPDADGYVREVAAVLASMSTEFEDGLFDGWTYAGKSDFSGHDWALLSQSYQVTHEAWLKIEPPPWADGFHTAVDAYFGLVINASLAASTRGTYVMGAYTVVIETARVSVLTSLGNLDSACPLAANDLANILEVALPEQAATPES